MSFKKILAESICVNWIEPFMQSSWKVLYGPIDIYQPASPTTAANPELKDAHLHTLHKFTGQTHTEIQISLFPALSSWLVYN